eukprot:987166-Alexandrium_andersonii.AAC.1
MSASLVGSEMCIRDRFSMVLVRCPGVLLGLSIHWVDTDPCLVVIAVEEGTCLLYTSDAADDM